MLHAIAGLRRPRRVEVAVAFGLTVTWGLLDEIHQAFVPGRATQLEDVAVDAVGAAIGVGIVYLILRRSSRPAGAGSTDRL